MKKSKNNFSFQKYFKTLNEIDINVLILKAKEINLEDLKNIDFNKLKLSILKSNLLKPSIGLIGASFLFSFLLFPSIKQLINTFVLSNQYEMESKSLLQKKLRLKNLEQKLKKASILISELNEAILNKEDILFISKLINETAIKSNVEIISFLPIDATKSSKLCNISNRNVKNRNSNRTKNITARKGTFQKNFFEVNLKSNYLDMIQFLNLIQNYDVVILPNCLKVSLEKYQKDLNKIETSNKTNIVSLTDSGVPIDSSRINSTLLQGSSYKRVKSRLVLQIPSHSKS